MNPIDRWGMTPLEGAAFGNHQDIIAMIQKAGGLVKDRATGQLIPIEESHVAAATANDKQVFTADLMAWEIPDEELQERHEIGAGVRRGDANALARHRHRNEAAPPPPAPRRGGQG